MSVWDGHSWNLTKNSRLLFLRQMLEHRGKTYALGVDRDRMLQSNFYEFPYHKLYVFENNKWTEVQTPFSGEDHLSFLFEHKGHLYVAGNFEREGCLNIALIRPTWVRVSGKVYHDANGNCGRDEDEKFYADARVRFTPGNYIVNTDENGEYVAYLDGGTYTAQLISKKHHESICQTGPQLVDVAPGDIIHDLDIAQRPVPQVKDLSVSLTCLTGFRVRRGATVYYYLHVKNQGTATVPASQLIMSYDKRAVNFLTPGTYTRIDNTTILFPLDSLPAGSEMQIPFTLEAKALYFVVHDSILMSARITNSYNDADTSDNRDTLHQRVVGAYDPNEKQCYPEGIVTKEVKEIKYHIYFQNMGNDSAVRIRIVDTFDVRLPIEKVFLDGSSHKYSITLVNNVMTWTFDNIMLPPERDNAHKSQGYVSFTAKLNGTMIAGDTIRNRAYIYFDYEDAVITNIAEVGYKLDHTSVPKISKTQQLGPLLVYPNPADDRVYITVKGAGSHDLSLYDIQGRLVSGYRAEGMGEHSLDVSSLQAGIYFLRDNLGQAARIVIQH